MAYLAPEILKGGPYTKAADIYSFCMIMYFIATGKQPFADCNHDQSLALNICNGIRPEINELEAPKCYIDLMKHCWDPNPANRPNAVEIENLIRLFYYSYTKNAAFESVASIKKEQQRKIEKQFKEAEEYRKSHLSSFEESRYPISHPQAI